jgi:hypothetical protein
MVQKPESRHKVFEKSGEKQEFAPLGRSRRGKFSQFSEPIVTLGMYTTKILKVDEPVPPRRRAGSSKALSQ